MLMPKLAKRLASASACSWVGKLPANARFTPTKRMRLSPVKKWPSRETTGPFLPAGLSIRSAADITPGTLSAQGKDQSARDLSSGGGGSWANNSVDINRRNVAARRRGVVMGLLWNADRIAGWDLSPSLMQPMRLSQI